MQARSRWLLAILIFTFSTSLVLPTGAGIEPLAAPDDAASGTDAPDVPPSGIALRPDVVHDAAFDGPDDRWDWYRLDRAEGDAVHLEVRAASACVYAKGAERPTRMACAAPGRPASLWFHAGQGPIDIGVEGGIAEPYTIAYRVDGFAPRPATAVDSADDADTGRDAPGIAVPFVPVRPGGEYRGSAGQAFGDLYDWYVLDVPPGSHVRITGWTGSAACFDIFAPQDVDDDRPCDLRLSAPLATLEGTVGEGPWYLRVGAAAAPYGFTVQVL